MILAWLVSLILVGFLGYHWREVNERLKALEEFAKLKIKEKRELEVQNPSTLLDPDDAAQQAKYQREVLLGKLNPDD